MKVLHIINGLGVGGAEMFLLRLIEGCTNLPIENIICSLKPEKELLPQFEETGVDITFLNGRALGFATLRNTIKTTAPDVIHSWLYHSILATELARMTTSRKCPVFWGIHHTILRMDLEKRKTRLVIKSLRYLSSRPEKVIYVSNAGREQHENLGFAPSKSYVIPNGYDIDRFHRNDQAANRFRHEIGARPDDFLVGILARFNPVKDHSNFLKASARFAQQHPNAKFILVGREIDSSNRVLMEEIESLGIADRCCVLGERSDVVDILNGLDLLASSSLSEAFPIVVGEAMACETPVVVTDVGDSAFLVNQNDLVVPAASPDELADAWLVVAAYSREARQRLGVSLRQRIVDNFSIGSIATQYLNLYQAAARRQPS